MSPLAVENLTEKSSPDAIRDAIDRSYETCMDEPAKEGESVSEQQKRCGGMIYGIARTKTGKELKPRG